MDNEINQLKEEINHLKEIINKLKIESALKEKYIEELEASVLLNKRKKMASVFSPGNCI